MYLAFRYNVDALSGLVSMSFIRLVVFHGEISRSPKMMAVRPPIIRFVRLHSGWAQLTVTNFRALPNLSDLSYVRLLTLCHKQQTFHASVERPRLFPLTMHRDSWCFEFFGLMLSTCCAPTYLPRQVINTNLQANRSFSRSAAAPIGNWQ